MHKFMAVSYTHLDVYKRQVNGSIFGIQTLGNIIFISALVAALYYLGIIGAVVKVIGGIIGLSLIHI